MASKEIRAGQSSRHRFALIEAARGIAALLVVFHHADNQIALRRYAGVHVWAGHLGNFNVGVDFFFVLSGFIITWVHWNDLGHSDRLEHYARRRYLRIFPPYWGLLFPLIAYYAIWPDSGYPAKHDPLNMFLSVPLVPYVTQPIIGVAWTLTFEMFFYVLFAVIIFFGRRSLWFFPVWAAMILAASTLTLHYPLSFVLNPYNLEFIAGVGAAALLRRHEVPLARAVLCCGAALFLVLMLLAPHIQDIPLRGRLCFGLAATMIVLGAVEFERQRSVRVPAAARLLGSASYSLYLIHTYAVAFAIAIIWGLGGSRLPATVILLALVAFAIAVGIAYHRLAEPRLTALLRRTVPEPKLMPPTGPTLRRDRSR